MYDKLIKDLRENHDKYFSRDMQAADAIEKLSRDVDDLCDTIDVYRKELGGHPDPRGPEGPSGIEWAEP